MSLFNVPKEKTTNLNKNYQRLIYYINYRKRKVSPSILSEHISIQGEVQTKESLEIFGYVKGNINAEIVSIRKTGFVEGEINCCYLRVEGKFVGKVKSSCVELVANSKIIGEIKYGFIHMDEGVSFNGQCELDESLTVNIPELD